MLIDKKFIVDNLYSYLDIAHKIASDRSPFELGVGRVYYAGGTLCIDIFYKAKIKYILLINLDETFSIIPVGENDENEFRYLMDIKSTKKAFEIYELVKGKNKYYDECLSKSSIRHIFKK